MSSKLGVLALSAAVFATVSSASGDASAAAGDAKGFGERYQLIITGDRILPLFSYASASADRLENGNITVTDSTSGANLSLLLGRNLAIQEGGQFPANVHTIPRIAFDFTVIPRLTLGAAIAFGFGLGGSTETETIVNNTRTTTSNDSPTGTAIGLAPRVGYIIPITEHLAIWPRGGFAFYSVSFTQEDTTGNPPAIRERSTTDTILALDIDPTLAIVPVENFFFSIGPMVNIPLSGSRSTETRIGGTTASVSNDVSIFNIGISAAIGGWIGF